jgi:hypothetical protein
MPFIVYALWVIVMAILLLRAVANQPDHEQRPPTS